jgi:hypothetical protein
MSVINNVSTRTKASFIQKMPMRKIRLVAVIIIAIAFTIPAVALGPYALRVQRFNADPTRGYRADFYLYVSGSAKRTARAGGQVTILVQPNNSGTSSDDPNVHRKDAW